MTGRSTPMGKALTSDARVSYWLKGQRIQNFGDLLAEVLVAGLRGTAWSSGGTLSASGDYDVIHILGSVIANGHIQRDLEHVRATGGRPVAFWGCGMREDKPVRPDLLERCTVLGARGPLTRDGLGLPVHTPLGDPALLLPVFYTPKPRPDTAGRILCVPHFLESKTDAELLELTSAELVLRPNIAPTFDEILVIVDALAGAKLVLAGALHAAIVACAYGAPFAYLDSGFVDVPFKWVDFAASVGIEARFVRSAAEGAELYAHETRPRLRPPPLRPLLACGPFRPSRAQLARASRPGPDRAL